MTIVVTGDDVRRTHSFDVNISKWTEYVGECLDDGGMHADNIDDVTKLCHSTHSAYIIQHACKVNYINVMKHVHIFSARQHIGPICRARYMLSPVRLSVRLSVSVTRVDQSKTVEVRIVQLSPQSSLIPLVLVV